jgi:hypothetical protein
MRELLGSLAVAAVIGLPPAPTLLWSDSATPAAVRGLTQQGTTVDIRINGQPVPGIRYGASRGGVSSFSAPWPAKLPAGVYEITARASSGNSQSAANDPVEVVVPGLRRIQLRPA